MKTFLIYLSLVLTSAFLSRAQAEELDLLFLEPDVVARAPASAYPEELNLKFEAEPPIEREPSSIANPKLAHTTALPKAQQLIPPEVIEGFDIRSIMKPANKNEKPIVNSFRVERNRIGYYLRFDNSSGSKSEVRLSPETFSMLKQRAHQIPKHTVNIKTCAGAMQLIEKVKDGFRLSTHCLTSKSKEAEELRSLGNLLVTWVR